MSEKLEQLNQAAADVTQTDFKNCCGSKNWARMMIELRPFANTSALIKQAEEIWLNLETEDWLEAFAAHPKIGARKAAPKQQAQSASWSHGEQSGTHAVADSVLDALAEANRLYEEKFGFIFIVCATGKSAEEMLDLCRRRLKNDADSEIRIAVDEQRKITEIRLRKLLEIE
ncbi:MAG: 2-oxo-4-hydroxy-4-carboxy-5-ureidoimidazoline decarboxylase [Acidobacteria bacterium]|nr:2-oxo-4-hydroxy-4-carboxy-5-ureidoimidazoline decarboxylase [Acidobacteriota bacterium]MCA1637181.1 2-oxo-4-hydroxy-4-carboxy-5-ureidoimidazoline decarboxylase [Acidobacteriota bacterium]